jgi:Tfp pilus assembly protein PilF
MQDATPSTVLGDFNDAEARHFSSKARFFKKDGRFLVETEGKDGAQAEFEVRYAFGVDPLQQYLVEFPDGRLQALPYAWDARPASEGGQRWLHLYPGEDIGSRDTLHWTGPQQNWNHMCAECHATDLRKNYDSATDSFKTAVSEIGVGCEACHGPGAQHVRWAQDGRPPNVANSGFPSAPAKRGAVSWAPDTKTGSPATRPRSVAGSVNETCDRCHSRRAQIAEGWRPGEPLADTHLPVFLTSDLFEDDGQMRDEVFNTSSFQQSKMFSKGVVCTDCHHPHDGKLKAAKSEICSQCHAAGKFVAAAHTGHPPGPDAPDCVACHMPARAYMVVDFRHDHSFRIPRPDLTLKIGTPNACASCHKERAAAWAAAAIERWHGPVRKGFQTYAEAFYAARLDLPEARELLLNVARDPAAPAIARATALVDLRERPSASVASQIERGLQDAEPLVRVAAIRALEPFPFDVRWRLAKAALGDPIRAVRIEAAWLLADAPMVSLDDAARNIFVRAAQDYAAAKQLNADRAEERTNLGGFYMRQGKADLGENEYHAAIRLSPRFIPPRVNLADLYRKTGREDAAEQLLRETVAEMPDAAAAHHALGLSLIRQKRFREAIESLKRAAELDLAQPRYAYVYGVALQSAGQEAEGRKILASALGASPSNTDLLAALLQDALSQGRRGEALAYVERLEAMQPDNRRIAALARELRVQSDP